MQQIVTAGARLHSFADAAFALSLTGLSISPRHVQEIDDRHEVREVAALDRPVVRLAVGHERPARGGIEVPRLRLPGHHRPEGPAVLQAGQARPHQPLGSPRLGLGIGDRRGRRRGRLRRFRQSRYGVRGGERIAGLAGHLLHQTLDTPWLHQRGRWFRLRVLGVRDVRQRDQAGDLVLLVFRFVHAGPGVSRPRP